MADKRSKEKPTLDMTPMIDVVFELIIFFVVTLQQENLFTKLNVNRPAPPTEPQNIECESVNIEIGRARSGNPNGVILYNKRELGGASFQQARVELDRFLKEIARTSTKTPIIVKCAENSPHKALVDVLDICYKNDLYSVSVFSL